MKDINAIIYKLVMPSLGITAIGFLTVAFMKLIPMYGGIILFVSAIVSAILFTIEYKRNKASDRFRYINMVCFLILYMEMVFMTGYDIMFAMGLILICLYVLYFDIKLMVLMSGGIALINYLAIIMRLVTGKMFDGSKADGPILFLQFAMVSAFAVVIITVTKTSKKVNDEKLKIIEVSNKKSNDLLEDVLSTAKNVKNKMGEGISYISDLDVSTDNSLTIFKEIAAGNATNTERIAFFTNSF